MNADREPIEVPVVRDVAPVAEPTDADVRALIAGKLSDVGDDPVRAVYERWLAGKAAGTVQTYGDALADFADWLGAGRNAMAGFRALVACGSGPEGCLLVQQYVDARREFHAPATVKLRASALKSVCRLARRMGILDWGIDVDTPAPVALRDTRGPEVDEIARLVAELDTGDDPPEVVARDRAVVGLLFACALRRAEVVGLDMAHVEGGSTTPSALWVKRKRKHDRELVGLPDVVGEWISAWILARGVQPGPLFIRLPVDDEAIRWTGHALYMRLRKLAKRHKVARLRPHALRHAAASALVEREHPLVAVQQVLAHADPKTTRMYIDNAARLAAELPAELADAIRPTGSVTPNEEGVE